MQINKWQNFTYEGHLFYVIGMQINSWSNFTDKGHLFQTQTL